MLWPVLLAIDKTLTLIHYYKQLVLWTIFLENGCVYINETWLQYMLQQKKELEPLVLILKVVKYATDAQNDMENEKEAKH